jgi:small subunit ribosomal protein S17
MAEEKNEIEAGVTENVGEPEEAEPEAVVEAESPEEAETSVPADGAPVEPAEEPVEPVEEAVASAEEPAPVAAAKPKPAPKKAAPRKPKAEPKKPAPAAKRAKGERKPIVRLPKPERERGKQKERRGVVVSSAMDKTIVVRVDTVRPHPAYKKVVKRAQKFHAHDEQNAANVGDVVRIVETRPISKSKSWRLAEVVEVAK